MHDTTAPTLPAGSYAVHNPATFTSQAWDVLADQVRVFSARSGAYEPQFLYCMTTAEAAELLRRAELLGFAAPVYAAPRIGKASAYELHKELGRLGFRDHYATASEALGVPVTSLAALSAPDAHTVRSYARGQWGLSA